MEIGKKKAICLNCKTKMSSSVVIMDVGDESSLIQSWFFKCPTCQQHFKYAHSNLKVVRNVSYMLLIFLLLIATLILFLIDIPKTKIAAMGTSLMILLLSFLYSKNAYGEIRRINEEKYNLILQRIEEEKEREKVIEAHRHSTRFKRIIRTIIILIFTYILRETLKKFGLFE